jgi:hypothetical protein
MVASSFGKLVMKEDPREGVSEEDLALALLMMITNNIGQVAYLNAQLNNCSKIFFVGSFLRHNSISCRRLAFAIEFWAKGKMEALFLHHEGYFGALGTFLQSALGDDVDKILLQENYNKMTRPANTPGGSNNPLNPHSPPKSIKPFSKSTIDELMSFKLATQGDETTPRVNLPQQPQMRRGRSVSDDVSHHYLFNSGNSPSSPARNKSSKH